MKGYPKDKIRFDGMVIFFCCSHKSREIVISDLGITLIKSEICKYFRVCLNFNGRIKQLKSILRLFNFVYERLFQQCDRVKCMIAENKFSASVQKQRRKRNWEAKTKDTNRWDFFIRDYYANNLLNKGLLLKLSRSQISILPNIPETSNFFMLSLGVFLSPWINNFLS